MVQIAVVHLPENRIVKIKTNGAMQPTWVKFDDVSLIVSDNGNGGFNVDLRTQTSHGSSSFNFSEVQISVEDIDIEEIRSNMTASSNLISDPLMLQVCTICNGNRCCVTNGCADFGCGWFCG